MKVKFLIIIFFLIAGSINCYPQLLKYVVVDEISNLPVAYCGIRYSGNQSLYSDGDGVFYIADTIRQLELSHPFYYKESLSLSKDNKTLRLRPKSIELKEVVIEKSIRKPKEVSYGDFDERTKFMWFCFPKTEFIVFMKPDEKLTNSSVKTIRIPVVSDKRFDELETDKYIFRLTVYDAKKEAILSEILEVSKEQILNDAVSYTPHYELLFPDEGLYFGVELLGWDTEGAFMDNSYYIKGRHSLSFRFSKTKEYYTFYHTPFKGDGQWQFIRERVDAFQLTFDKPIGLSLGLILNKYN